MEGKEKGFKGSVNKMLITVDNFIWLMWSPKNKRRWKVLIFIILTGLYWGREIVNGVKKILE